MNSTTTTTTTTKRCFCPMVNTYAFAYVQGSIDLCRKCADHYSDAVLGPVLRGRHIGQCAGVVHDLVLVEAIPRHLRAVHVAGEFPIAGTVRRIMRRELATAEVAAGDGWVRILRDASDHDRAYYSRTADLNTAI